MKYINTVLLISFIFLFTACSSKEQVRINDKMNSFSLDNNIVIGSVPRTVKSPISIGLGLGGYISRHVGISVGTSIRPDISNDDALVLERALAVNNLSLSSLVKEEFKRQMQNDPYYKNKFVAFGSDYTIHLYVPKYYLDGATFSSKAQVKIALEIRIFNKFDEIIYEDIQENPTYYENNVFNENEILNSKEILQKVVNEALQKVIANIIMQMKRS
jgi:hypothetical protein